MTIQSHFTFCLAFFVAGCANTSTSWRESVMTSDRRLIELERAETRSAYAHPSLPGSGYPESQRLSSSIPGLGDLVWEEGSGYSLPIGFDIIDGIPWLIQENDGPCERNPTRESMRIFRYYKEHWEQVRIADAPKQLKSNLTFYSGSKSEGRLGSRPFRGLCDKGLRQEGSERFDEKSNFGYSPRFPEHCGQVVEELQDSLLTSRNCARNGYPLSPSFPEKWEVYNREEPKKFKASVIKDGVTPTPLPEIASDYKNRFYVPPSMFSCIIGCRKNSLAQIATYVPPHKVDQKGYTTWDGNSIYEFLLSGPEKKRFYANVRNGQNFQLWCDGQGYKIIDYRKEYNKPVTIHATIFDRDGTLTGKWDIGLPDKATAPELYRPEKLYTFFRGLELERDGSLRIVVGQSKEWADSCRLSEKFITSNQINFIELRTTQ